jgi:hypothetical protein
MFGHRVPASIRPLGALVCLFLASCSTGSESSSFVNPTYVRVDPAQFTARVECAAAGTDAGTNSLSSYVATLVRVEYDEAERKTHFVTSLRSTPTPCSRAVNFDVSKQRVTEGRSFRGYSASLWGYVEPADEVPAPPTSDDSAEELGQPLGEPSWAGSCGLGEVDTGPGDAGVLEFELDAGILQSDSEFAREFYGPQRPVGSRTVTLRGCALRPVKP